MMFKHNHNVQDENQAHVGKVSSQCYGLENQRQFGKEITNISSKADDIQISSFQPYYKQKVTLRQTKQDLTCVADSPKETYSSQEPFTQYLNETYSFDQMNDTQMQEELPYTLDEKMENDKIEKVQPHQPQYVSMYINEIFEYLIQKEKLSLPLPNYMNDQKDITASMRSILVDWLVDVHFKFKLDQETLFLTVNLIDRFLSNNQILRSKLQLIGVSAMFIASKYEEIYAPDIKDFVYVCDKAYSKEEILEMESKILLCVQFDLTHTSSLRFLERQCIGANICEKVTNSAKMILELALVEPKCLQFCPSLLATSSVLFAINLLDSPQILPTDLHFNKNSEELKQCFQEMILLIQNLNKSNLTAIKRKYAQDKYCQVSDLVCNIINYTQQY